MVKMDVCNYAKLNGDKKKGTNTHIHTNTSISSIILCLSAMAACSLSHQTNPHKVNQNIFNPFSVEFTAVLPLKWFHICQTVSSC